MDAFRTVVGCVLAAQLAGQAALLHAADEPGVNNPLSIDAAAPAFPIVSEPSADPEPPDAADAIAASSVESDEGDVAAGASSSPAEMEPIVSMPPSPAEGEASPDAVSAAEQPGDEPVAIEVNEPTPPELVADMLKLGEGSRLDGRPLTLFEALSPAQGQLARLEIIHSYWRLVQAVGQYRVALDQSRLLDSLAEVAVGDPALATARVSAEAALERAELLAVTAQYDLASAALLPTDNPPPVPADLPHIGPYRTYFEALFSERPAPPRVRLVDRTLPIARRAIDLRAEAIIAAEKALDEAVAACRTGHGDVKNAVELAADRARQQRELLVSVCRYNHDIADYALAVINPQARARDVVAMLITTARDLPEADVSEQTASTPPEGMARAGAAASAVEQAAHNEPLGASAPRRPTLAPPKGSAEAEAIREAQAPREIPATAGEEGISPIPRGEDAPAAEGPVAERPMVPVIAGPDQPFDRVTRRPIPEGADIPAGSSGLYPALVGKEPAVQAKQLAAALHWLRVLPEPVGERVTLAECLRGVPSGDRQRVIERYWLTAQKAAEYQALVSGRNMLEELAPLVASQAGETAAEESIRFQAARAEAEADLLEAHRGLLESQLELTQAAGRSADSEWLLPATQPHCGPYALKLDAQPRELVESWSMRRLTAMIPGLADALSRSAAAVVQSDARRAALTAEYRSGNGSLNQVLHAVERQTDETVSFLDMLATYNRAIARYAVAVLPAAVSEDQLVGTLVLK